jgi:tripeptidyl-peptidase I
VLLHDNHPEAAVKNYRIRSEANMILSSVRRFAAVLAVASQLSCILAHPATAKTDFYAVHEKRSSLPAGWSRLSSANPYAPITLRVGLKQGNLHLGDEKLAEISDPSSAEFGKHWSPQQVAQFFAPSDESISSIRQWLEGVGIDQKDVKLSKSKGWIHIGTTVNKASELLDTSFNVYENENEGLLHIACEEYSLPVALRNHVDLVTPTIQFDPRDAVRHTKRGAKPSKRESKLTQRDFIPPRVGKKIPHPPHVPDSLANCTSETTPACLRALYGIPENVPSVQGNTYGVVEFAPQSFNQDDLNLFFKTYTSNVPSGTSPVFEAIDGGYLSSDADTNTRGESNLDLSYAMSLFYPSNVTLYQVGDSVLFQPATNNNFLDAIDGSYCSYDGGDDPDWDAIYPHSNDTVGAWTQAGQCGTVAATKVISVSYGRNEASHPQSYNERECYEYMKLGLMGISVLFSSGDDGVSGLRGQCLTPEGAYTPPGAEYGIFNPMVCSINISCMITLSIQYNANISVVSRNVSVCYLNWRHVSCLQPDLSS